MTRERMSEIIDLTVGWSVPAADVGIGADEAAEFARLLDTDAEVARLCAELRAASGAVSRAYVPPPDAATDAQIAARVVASLPARSGGVRVLPRIAAAAVLLVGAAVLAWTLRPSGASPVGPPAGGTVETPYPLAPPPCDDWTGPRFTDVTADSGIATVRIPEGAQASDWMVEVVGHGAAVFDMDGDGDLDLFVPDGNRIDRAESVLSPSRLFRNEGGMRFTDVSAQSGIQRDGWAVGAVAADFNADGRPDLFVACWGGNRMFWNLGGGRFADATPAAGVGGDEDEWSTGASVGDVDGDGDLDIYVSNYADMRRFMSETSAGRGCTWRDMAVPCGPQPLVAQPDRLFLNRGDGTFVDATEERLPVDRRYSFQPVMADLDGDGDLDVFVAADGHPNLLLINDGTGHFRNDAMSAGCATSGDGRDQACMGVAVGDADGDGVLDLFVTNFSHEPNVLYRARPGGASVIYADASSGAGLAAPSLHALGWGVAFSDADRDGDLDLLVANGHLYPDVGQTVPETAFKQHLALFRNAGDGTFDDVTSAAGSGLLTRRAHRGLVVADFDDDGHADLFVTALNAPSALLRNDGRGTGAAVRLVLRRADGRTEAAGAHVEARVVDGSTDRTIHRALVLGSSFGCSEDPRLSIGLGAAGGADVTVRWPLRAGAAPVRESFGRLEAGGTYEIVEGTGVARRLR